MIASIRSYHPADFRMKLKAYHSDLPATFRLYNEIYFLFEVFAEINRS